MICQELMIGDYIQSHKQIYRVAGIKPLSDIELVVMDTNGKLLDMFIDDVEPISVSLEILNQNGFELQRDKSGLGTLDTYWLGSELGAFRIHRLNNGDYQFGLVKIKFVHQLQQALRLCGINKDIEI